MRSHSWIRYNGTVSERWEYLTNCSESMIGTFSISPLCDLPWMFHTIIQKLKELEVKNDTSQ